MVARASKCPRYCFWKVEGHGLSTVRAYLSSKCLLPAEFDVGFVPLARRVIILARLGSSKYALSLAARSFALAIARFALAARSPGSAGTSGLNIT
jgi:hypothetical protein